jgi:hypothetical protein
MGALITTESVNSVVAYESMCRWIVECEDRAECKDIADKSVALQEYARRIKNTEAERRACNVRLIAERRYGELLKQLVRATPQTANLNGRAGKEPPARGAGGSSPYREALDRDGISERKAERLQALADVPQETFDEAIRDPVAKPSASRLVQEARDPQPKMPDDVLWLWGRMLDFERDGFASKNPAELLAAMTETMRAGAERIAPLMADFFTRMESLKK